MRTVRLIEALGLSIVSAAAVAQVSPGPAPGPLGGYQSPSNNPGSGSGDMPGYTPALDTHRPAGMLKGAYGLDLSNRIANAQKLVDEVGRGRLLTAADTRHVRDLMREDFVAWSKRFDLLPSAYRSERDRWLVDAASLSPNDWAKQRLNWLNAQRDWVLAHGG